MQSTPSLGNSIYPWIAIHVKVNKEKIVSLGLRERGYEFFLPTYQMRRQWCDRQATFDLPLFPGYVFCRWMPANRYRVKEIPGVIQIVSAGGSPAHVDEGEMGAIHRIVNSHLVSMPWKFMHAGEQVRIEDGVLRGLIGTFVRTGKDDYLIVNVTLLQRGVAVKIKSDQVSVRAGALGEMIERIGLISR